MGRIGHDHPLRTAGRLFVGIVILPFHEAIDVIARGEISDAKTIIALQHLALLQAGKADLGTLRGGWECRTNWERETGSSFFGE
jgi:hypothetical protein